MTEYAKNLPIRGNNMSGMDQINDKPRCRVIQTTAQAIAVSGAATKISFDNVTTADVDTDGMWNATNLTRVTIRTTGFYSVWAYVRWAVGAAGVQRDAWISKNNVAFKYVPNFITFPSATVSATNVMATGMALFAGDYLEVLVLHDFGASLSLSNGGGDSVAAELIACLIST